MHHSFFKHHKKITAVIVPVSVLSLFLSPLDKVKDKIMGSAPELLALLATSELLFIAGIIIMASAVGLELGKNPLTWRKHFHGLVKEITTDNLFWTGFWINAVGALATGILIGVGVVILLPPQSWGLIWLAVADIAITLLIRGAVLELRQEYKK